MRIDLLSNIPVPDPYDLYFTPDGRHAIVVEEGKNTLSVRDFAYVPMLRERVDEVQPSPAIRVRFASVDRTGRGGTVVDLDGQAADLIAKDDLDRRGTVKHRVRDEFADDGHQRVAHAIEAKCTESFRGTAREERGIDVVWQRNSCC